MGFFMPPKSEKRGKYYMEISIGLWIVIIVGGFVGIASSLYVVVSLFATLGYKIYRKCKYGISLFN